MTTGPTTPSDLIQTYLSWAFDRLGTRRDLFALPLEQLTPAAFKRTLG